MTERLVARMIAPLARAIGNMLARGTLVLVNAASKMQTVQVRLLSGEAKEAVEHFEPYGFTACPHPGAEALAAFLAGDRSHGVVLTIADRRYRLQGLEAGEVALHDDLEQKVHLTRTGIVVSSPLKVRIEAQDIEMHASHSWSWDVNGFGERWTHVTGSTWEHKTWQTGATVNAVSLSIHPPEGP
jgi:phage baseplate assembly protein V